MKENIALRCLRKDVNKKGKGRLQVYLLTIGEH